MSDIDLLKNAARACGYEWNHGISRVREAQNLIALWVYGVSTAWDPLNDNGHALGLAVKLRLDICHASGLVYVGRIRNGRWLAHKSNEDDAEAATRRAIVMAAAAVGISMFGQRENSCDREAGASWSVVQSDGESDAVRGHACRSADRDMVSTAAGQELLGLAIDELKNGAV